MLTTEERIERAKANRLEDAPKKYRLTLSAAFEGKASPRVAIKAYCLLCTGYERRTVQECTSWACPLHAYRPYQAGEGSDAEDASQSESRQVPEGSVSANF